MVDYTIDQNSQYWPEALFWDWTFFWHGSLRGSGSSTALLYLESILAAESIFIEHRRTGMQGLSCKYTEAKPGLVPSKSLLFYSGLKPFNFLPVKLSELRQLYFRIFL